MISYIGGKAKVGKWIVPFIPNYIETYVEVFLGMFWVFFNMDLKKFPRILLKQPQQKRTENKIWEPNY